MWCLKKTPILSIYRCLGKIVYVCAFLKDVSLYGLEMRWWRLICCKDRAIQRAL